MDCHAWNTGFCRQLMLTFILKKQSVDEFLFLLDKLRKALVEFFCDELVHNQILHTGRNKVGDYILTIGSLRIQGTVIKHAVCCIPFLQISFAALHAVIGQIDFLANRDELPLHLDLIFFFLCHMACPPFSEILMVSQNFRSGGERQRGFDTLKYETTLKSPFFGTLGRSIRFLVERKKSALCPRQNTDFFS
ncbi:hypothetical protein DSY0013 [Desulfitobacterium hafniense Y51]|uniref:Uncharacterized protein n=1 Tax=Desulfitobacterium hafniense (strain Y51) TaxID=138119 RepID=Q252J0_DESHY|nr:hypothetical protein DSY0013 [Desulfitobacterium hafniense Y51]